MKVKHKVLGLMCGIMVLAMGTGAALAADKGEAKPATMTYAAEDAEGNVTMSHGSIMVKTDEDGVTRYSTDGGETWTEGLPEGMEFELNEDGSLAGHSFILGDGEISEGAEFSTMMIQTDDDGNTRYSTDGGETWTEGLPEGAEFGISGGIPSDAEHSRMMIKMDDEGSVSYSTDGGETWTEGLPDGAEFEINEDGGSMIKNSVDATAL